MSKTWHVEGIIPKDDRWKRMADVWNACKMACVPKRIRVYQSRVGEA